MAMGVTDHIWTVEELIIAALTKEPISESPKRNPVRDPARAAMNSASPAHFTVLRGGKDVE